MRKSVIIIGAVVFASVCFSLLPSEKASPAARESVLKKVKVWAEVPQKEVKVPHPSSEKLQSITKKISALHAKRSRVVKRLKAITSDSVHEASARSLMLQAEDLDRDLIRETRGLISLLKEV